MFSHKYMLNSTINPDCSEYIIYDYDIEESENVFTELNNIITSMCPYLMNKYTTIGTIE